MNDSNYLDTSLKHGVTKNVGLGKNNNGDFADLKNRTYGQYTGWEEENIPKDENGNYKKRKDIGSNESWLLNPEDYI